MDLKEAAFMMDGYHAAFAMYLYDTASFIQNCLLTLLYMNVGLTWMLNKILGNFTPYVGIEYNYPLMLEYELPPREPDCSLSMDWILVVALVFLLLYSLAITSILNWTRRTPILAKSHEDDDESDIQVIIIDIDDDPPDENGSTKLEEYWYRVGDELWRSEVKFVHNGYEKIFYIYSKDTDEMKDFLQNGLPEHAVNGVFEYMQKHVISNN